MIIGTQRQERSCHVIASFWAELSRATPSYKKLESKCYGLQRGENMFQYVAAEIAHLYNIILFWCIRYLFKIFQACFMSTSRRMRIGSEEEYSQYSWFAPIIIGYIEPHINPVIAGWICPPSGEVVPPRTSCSLSFTKRWWCYFSSIGFQDSKVPSKRAPPQFTSRFWGCECQSWCFHILLCTTVLFPIIFETFRRKSAPTKTSEQFHWKNCGRFFSALGQQPCQRKFALRLVFSALEKWFGDGSSESESWIHHFNLMLGIFSWAPVKSQGNGCSIIGPQYGRWAKYIWTPWIRSDFDGRATLDDCGNDATVYWEPIKKDGWSSVCRIQAIQSQTIQHPLDGWGSNCNRVQPIKNTAGLQHEPWHLLWTG